MALSHEHPHAHAALDASVLSHKRGLWAVKWSAAALIATALIQTVIVVLSNSVALLADTVHNFADAATAVPLGIAFLFAGLKPGRKFTYGYGRIEDLAGVAIVVLILFSAVFAGVEAVRRFFQPQPVDHLGIVAIAAIAGFAGNEAVAMFRIKVGKEIGSAALIADGYHARVDGWSSLAVLAGAAGVWLGYPLADPIVGLGISAVIFYVAANSARLVFTRMLDGVEPALTEEIRHAAMHVAGVEGVGQIRARWIGHKLYAEINVCVRPEASVSQGHEIAEEVSREMLRHVPQLGKATVHVDPADKGCGAEGGSTHEHCR